MGFTGFADVSGRGQVILDGDPLIMRTFTRDEERQSAINLFTMAGAAIAITDQVDTIADNAHIFQNREVLALRKDGLVGKPVFNNSHALDYDPTSRDPERWIGQLPDGSWAVALFNRSDAAATKSITFADVLGFSGPAAVRDLWAHQDLGSMTGYQVALGPHASVLLSVVPQGRGPLPGRGGRLGGLGPLREHLRRSRRDGLRHRPRERGEQRGRRHRRPEGREPAPRVPRGQRHREPVRADGARARSRDRPRARLRRPQRAERLGVDLLADRAGHAAAWRPAPTSSCAAWSQPIRAGSISTTSPWPEPIREPQPRSPSGPTRAQRQPGQPARLLRRRGRAARRRTPRRPAVPSSPSPGGRPAASAAPTRRRPAAAARAAWRGADRARVPPARRTAGRPRMDAPGMERSSAPSAPLRK